MHLFAASTQRNLGMAIAVVAIVGFAIYLIYNVLWAGRGEKGSEVELAPNRKPYLSDEELETSKLDLALVSGLVTLVIIGVALPLYWLGEPGRQQGYVEYSRDQFTSRGAGLFEESCSSCHGGGGLGGTTDHTITDDNGNFVAAIKWEVPALTTTLYRFSEVEVRHILDYGRPPTPMQAWGTPGGGPLTTQQVDELIQYIQSIQLSPDQLEGEVLAGLISQVRDDVLAANDSLKETWTRPTPQWRTRAGMTPPPKPPPASWPPSRRQSPREVSSTFAISHRPNGASCCSTTGCTAAPGVTPRETRGSSPVPNKNPVPVR